MSSNRDDEKKPARGTWYPPVIFIGMHRSGTSLLGRLLEEVGLFAGKEKEENNEAVFFLNLNRWLMRQAGASWDNPAAFDYLLKDNETKILITKYLDNFLRGPRTRSYLGTLGYVRYHGIRNGLPSAWGWKDPRNTYTLPIWLELFPEARVIYIERHGVDVAQSLVTRRNSELGRATKDLERFRRLYMLRPKRGGFSGSIRCGTLEQALALWSEYVQRGRQHAQLLGDRCLTVHYEELLRAPVEQLRRVVEFCDLNVGEDTLANVTKGIHAGRAYAYKDDPRLKQFSEANESRLLGYRA